jgi:hypothetical protein
MSPIAVTFCPRSLTYTGCSMKTVVSLLAGSVLCAASGAAFAWSQPTHKMIVMDAMSYMGSSQATAEQKRAYNYYAKAAGGDALKAADALGQACYDVDNFKDVHLGFWWTGYYDAPLFGLARSVVGYNAYHHFTTMSRGSDAHGNPHGGYNYRHRTPNGSLGKGEFFDIDTLAAVYLWNTELRKRDYDTTEANYRQGSFSSYEQYRDFQDIPWQPSANAGKYWFGEFLKQPTFQTVGYSLHFLTDASQPHHTQSTSANHHAGWEGWVEDNYKTGKFADFQKVSYALGKFNTRDSVQNLVIQMAGIAYARPEPLYATDFDTRNRTAQALIPESIAATVTVLTKAVNCLNNECGVR